MISSIKSCLSTIFHDCFRSLDLTKREKKYNLILNYTLMSYIVNSIDRIHSTPRYFFSHNDSVYYSIGEKINFIFLK